jgi:hypothetical protein
VPRIANPSVLRITNAAMRSINQAYAEPPGSQISAISDPSQTVGLAPPSAFMRDGRNQKTAAAPTFARRPRRDA